MLAPWKKSNDQPRQHIKKQRHYFAHKGPSSQGYGFPLVMYGCESWTIKKAECWRIYAFELWYWRRLLRVPWTAGSSNQSILKEISPEYSSEGLMLKLKLHTLATWYEEVTHLKRPWCCERLKAGGEGDNRGWDGRIASLTQWTWVWVDSGSLWWTGNAEEWRMKNESGYWPYRKWKDYKGTSWTIVCQHIRWLFLSTKNEKETLSTHSMKPKTPWKC